MINTWNFNFMYHKTQLCLYVIHIMTHLHSTFDFEILNILKLYFELKKFQTPQFFNYE